MRAWRFDTLGLDGLSLHDEPMPEPQRGELLLRVRAVSLNYRDVAIPLGRYPLPALPGLIPTSDVAAEVVAVGADVRDIRPGDRVLASFHPRWFGGPAPLDVAGDSYGSARDGWLAEYKTVSQEAVVALPDTISDEAGATLPCAATTAWTALGGPTPIRAGDTVLTLGTGGVAIFGVQLAKALGARVVATTSSAAKAARLRALGADEVINYDETPDWGERVRALVPRGVDRVLETGGPGTIGQSLHAAATGGEVVLIGFLAAGGSGIDYFRLFGSGAVRSISVGSRADLISLVRTVQATGLSPVIDRVFDFVDARAAFNHLEHARHIGKIVIRLPG